MSEPSGTNAYEYRPVPVDEVVYQFEKAWRAGQSPRIDDFLQGDGPDRWHLLVELAHSELELRLRAGEEAGLADYLARYPALAHLPNELAALLETEVRVRAQRKEQPELKAYEARYPMLGPRVRAAFRRVGAAPPEVPGYELLDELGRGGMGVVYRATQVLLRRQVAVKLIRADRLDGTAADRFRGRFRREAEAVAAVGHPHVVQVYDCGESGGDLFLAMELVDGMSLQRHLDTAGVLAPRAAAGLAEKVARAVHAVHQKGIVHRDLKPDNVLLTAAGEPKVADFGLARPAEVADGKTVAGVVVGTPEYMSPEQATASGEDPTPRVDVYGVGAVLYAALTGRPPVPRGSVLDTLERVRTQPAVPVRQLRPDCPRDLETVTLKCLEKDPARRYPTAEALADDLRRWLDGQPITARPAGPLEKGWKWAARNKKLAGMGLAVLVTMAAATGVSLGFGLEANGQRQIADGRAGELALALGDKTKAEEDAREKANDLTAQLKESRRVLDLTRLREAEADFEDNAVQQAREKLAEIAPENRCLAWGLLNRRLRGSDVELNRPRDVFSPRMNSDDSSSLAFAKCCSPDAMRSLVSIKNRLQVRDITTGRVLVTLEGEADTRTCQFSPDGRKVIAVLADNDIRVWDTFSGRKLATFYRHTSHQSPYVIVSPDGRRIISSARYLKSDDTTDNVFVWDAESAQLITPAKAKWDVESARYVGDGSTIATLRHGGVLQFWNDIDGKATEIVIPGHKHLWHYAISPDVSRVVTSDMYYGTRVWLLSSGKMLCRLMGHKDVVVALAFSPDGRRIVTGSLDRTARVWDSGTGQCLLELKGHSSMVSQVDFTTDGQRIITQSPDRTIRIWDAWSGQSQTQMVEHASCVFCVTFSPDGRQLCTGSGDDTARIWDVETGRFTHELKGHNKTGLNWGTSPVLGEMVDGGISSVAYLSDSARIVTGSTDGSVRIWDAQSGRQLRSIELPEFRNYINRVYNAIPSTDGKFIVAASSSGVLKLEVETGGCVQLYERKDNFHMSIVPSLLAQAAPVGTDYLIARGSVVQIVDAETRQITLSLNLPESAGFITCISVDSTCGHIAIATADKIVRVWQSKTGALVAELKGHARWIQAVNFSLDGRRVVTGSADGTAKIWDAATGRALLTLRGHGGQPVSSQVDPDSTAVLAMRSAGVTSVAVSPDGRRVATASLDGTARVWEVDMEEHNPDVPPSAQEIARRKRIARPRPEVHAKLAEEYKADPFASGVQKSLEQKARGQLAMAAGDFDKAWGHFIAAEILRPKPSPPNLPKK